MKVVSTIWRWILPVAAIAVFAAMAVSVPVTHDVDFSTPYGADQPVKPQPAQHADALLAGLALALPTIAGAFLAAALIRARRTACPPCPSCGSRRGAVVGPVGTYRRCCRCHDCGFLWEQEAPAFSRTVTQPASTLHPPGEKH
jgi:hypothetical protein